MVKYEKMCADCFAGKEIEREKKDKKFEKKIKNA